MDVVRLDPITYLPDVLVEGYSSMIWTERFLTNGEFELKTAKVVETMTLIPELSLISHMETKELMWVENHAIGINANGDVELTTTGRSFDTFLENRDVVAPVYGQPYTGYRPLQYRASEIVSLLLWNALVNATGQDPNLNGRNQDALTAIPNLVITDSTLLPEDRQDNWWINGGPVLPNIRNFLAFGNLGIRNIRPFGTTKNVMTFDTDVTGIGTRGNQIKTLTTNIQDLIVDVYDGADRTHNQSLLPPVIFYYGQGNIDNPSYLFSSKVLKNMVRMREPVGDYGLNYWFTDPMDLTNITTPPDPEPTGLNRRILYLTTDDLGGVPDSGDMSAVNLKARIELQKYVRQLLFDGVVSPISRYGYGNDYFLGDKVSFFGDYGIEEILTVTEYIRTEDSNGDRGYPTLILAT